MALRTYERQVLVNTGNRYIVFGPDHGLPQTLLFDPIKDTKNLPRVADEAEVAYYRIVENIKIAGMDVVAQETKDAIDDNHVDLVAKDEEGSTYLIEIKTRERDPKQRDFEAATKYLNSFQKNESKPEVWFFNIERLKLVIMSDNGMAFNDMLPLDVWERNDDRIFDRAKVVAEVDDWENRLRSLFYDVKQSAEKIPRLKADMSRTVLMSEEMMQQFAVTDRDLPILDVTIGDEVLGSFVPRGLWLIGAWGRIDLITRTQTHAIVAIKDEERLVWKISSTSNRRDMQDFNLEYLPHLLGVA